jgi:hypothetical protein
MAFNHVGHLILAEGVTDEQIAGIVDGLVALHGQVDGLLSAQVVRDAGLTPGNAHLRFHMRFDTQASWEGYRTHPAHVAVVKNHIGPVLGSKAFVQYDDADVNTAGDLA